MDIAEHHTPDNGAAQQSRVCRIELFFLQCGKEALHSSVVVAAACAAHALPDLMALERSAEQPAGELAATVGVQNQAAHLSAAAGVLQGFHA